MKEIFESQEWRLGMVRAHTIFFDIKLLMVCKVLWLHDISAMKPISVALHQVN
jgi:hypothetical protein